MKKIFLLVALLGYFIASSTIARQYNLAKFSSITKSWADSAHYLADTVRMYSSEAKLHLLSTNIALLEVKLAQFSDIEDSNELRSEITGLYDKIKNFHDTYSQSPEQDRHETNLFINLELWLETYGRYIKLLFSWKDGDRQKTVQLLLDLNEELDNLAPQDINKLRNFLTKDN